MFKRWQQLLFLGGLVAVLGALWLWGSPPTAVHACDDLTNIIDDCEFDFEFRVAEKITVYRFEMRNGDTYLCARYAWVYINDRQKLMDNRSRYGPIYPHNGSVGVFKQSTYEDLLNDGVIDEAIVPLIFNTSTAEECVRWGEGHIQFEGPPTIPEPVIEPLDPIDPPLWKEIPLEEPIEGADRVYAYGYESEVGFYELLYVLPLE